MFIKPDYDVKNIFSIDLEELRNQGINALLFDLDSTLMGSKTGYYTEKTLNWLNEVRKDFFIGVVSNNYNPAYMEKVQSSYIINVLIIIKKPFCNIILSYYLFVTIFKKFDLFLEYH
jgi:predicted HAD superfamily phosphohydrolase YqeG